MLSEKTRGLLQGGNYGMISTVLPSGLIQTQPVWVDCDDEHVLVNTEVERRKYKNLDANPVVTVTVVDAQNPYNWVEVRGRMVEAVQGDAARSHIDTLAKRYMGVDDYPNPITSPRVIAKIQPDQVFEFPPGA